MKMKNLKSLLHVLIVYIGLLSLNAQAGVEITYIHNDALGSPVAGTDEQGKVKWRSQYRPYGEEMLGERPLFGVRTGYTGHRDDPETGLIYMGARYYSPTLGRFMGVDPADVDESNLHSFNRYAYANNNPYKYVDPDGRVTTEAAGLFVFGGLVGISVCSFSADCSQNLARGTSALIKGFQGVFNESDDIDSEIDNLTDGLGNEKDERGRNRRGQFVDPEGDAEGALDSLTGEPDNSGGKILPDGSRAGLHDSSGASGGKPGKNRGSKTLHINRPKGKQDIKIRFTK